MKYKTLQQVPNAKLHKWLVAAAQTFGKNCATAKVYRAELRRRSANKGVKRYGK